MINIQDIIPFMREGWVAMNKGGLWKWYGKKPEMHNQWACWQGEEDQFLLPFNIAPADDWSKSLIKVKGVK